MYMEAAREFDCVECWARSCFVLQWQGCSSNHVTMNDMNYSNYYIRRIQGTRGSASEKQCQMGRRGCDDGWKTEATFRRLEGCNLVLPTPAPRLWRPEGCNLELVSCRFRKPSVEVARLAFPRMVFGTGEFTVERGCHDGWQTEAAIRKLEGCKAGFC